MLQQKTETFQDGQHNFLQNREEVDALTELPIAYIKSIRFQDFRVFKDCEFSFENKKFVCFIGPNGTGKSTSLSIIQLLFQRFEGYEISRLKAYLGKAVRNEGDDLYSGIYTKNDFLVTANIQIGEENIEIKINKSGFMNDYPEHLKSLLYRLCFTTGFDKSLDKFQLVRTKWESFKELFEAITGYEIEEQKVQLSLSEDPIEEKMMQDYVLGFIVRKPQGVVSHKNCSDGERKVIKSLSTLLNMVPTPRIICIDNIEMHVEIQRHMPLINALKKCFPDSQIFSTTHSPRVIKTLLKTGEIYDLRFIYANELEKTNPGRIYLIDEIDNLCSQVETSKDIFWREKYAEQGKLLKKNMSEDPDFAGVCESMKIFSKGVSEHFINDMAALKNRNEIIAR